MLVGNVSQSNGSWFSIIVKTGIILICAVFLYGQLHNIRPTGTNKDVNHNPAETDIPTETDNVIEITVSDSTKRVQEEYLESVALTIKLHSAVFTDDSSTIEHMVARLYNIITKNEHDDAVISEFTRMIYVGYSSGLFVGVRRCKDTKELGCLEAVIIAGGDDADMKIYKIDPGPSDSVKIVLKYTEDTNFHTSTREWYKAGLHDETDIEFIGGKWTDPYHFFGTTKYGKSFVISDDIIQHGKEANIVYGVDASSTFMDIVMEDELFKILKMTPVVIVLLHVDMSGHENDVLKWWKSIIPSFQKTSCVFLRMNIQHNPLIAKVLEITHVPSVLLFENENISQYVHVNTEKELGAALQTMTQNLV
jgi:hypothetical protein